MKRFLLITLMAALSFSIHLRAQDTLNLKLDYSNARLSDVLNDFTRQTGITFSYEVTLGDMIVARLETGLKNASLETCLEAVFGHLNLTYKVDGRVVALSQPDNAVKKGGGKISLKNNVMILKHVAFKGNNKNINKQYII